MAGTRSESTFYRRPPGMGWLLGLLVVPLALAAVGVAATDTSSGDSGSAAAESSETATTETATSVGATDSASSVPATASTPAAAPAQWAPLSITRSGDGVTVSGDVPDAASRTALLDAIKAAFGDDVTVTDELAVDTDAVAPDVAGLSAVFDAAATIPDFGLAVEDGAVTLTGTAANDAARSALAAAAEAAWPGATITDNVTIGSSASPGAPTPSTPAVPGAECSALQGDIDGLLQTPIIFATDGFTLIAATQATLTEVADVIVGCPDAAIVVSGYTDNTGNDGINVPLSSSRAAAVSDYLVAQGVPAEQITSRGLGSADPVAPNNTAEGRSQNRRVEITVS